jgi:protein CpxP
MKTLKATLLAAIFATSLSALAMRMPSMTNAIQEQEKAGGEHRRGPMNPEAQIEHLTKELSLTDDQKAKIEPLMKEQFKQMQALRDDTSIPREQKMPKMREIHEGFVSQVRGILNEEQQKKLDKMMAEQKEKMHQHEGDKDSGHEHN